VPKGNGNGVHFRRTTDEIARSGYKEFIFRWSRKGSRTSIGARRRADNDNPIGRQPSGRGVQPGILMVRLRDHADDPDTQKKARLSGSDRRRQ
jgi:hypothetical protein